MSPDLGVPGPTCVPAMGPGTGCYDTAKVTQWEPGQGPGGVRALLERCLLCHLCQTLAPDALGVLAKWAAPEPCLSPCSGSALLQHGHAVLRPRGQPCSRLEATKPFWPLPSLCPVERSCRSRSHMPGRTQWVRQCLDGPHKPPLEWLLSP